MSTTDAPLTEEVLRLTEALVRRPSVTPQDAGCQALIAEALAPLGFMVEPMPFGDVSNLWARRGAAAPLVVFAGHTDVVPTGPVEAWSSPPFEPALRGGALFGRGAADMKSSLAAMLVAVRRFVAKHPNHGGSLAFLITSDEEGAAVDGTARVMVELERRGERIDFCVVGEPSSTERLGDVVRVGRRGSLNGALSVQGVQGHVAYPDQALNPVHAALGVLDALARRRWDAGNDFFPPTGFQISNIAAGTGAHNVIPNTMTVQFNFRFNTEQTVAGLKAQVASALAEGVDTRCDLTWSVSGLPFLTQPGRLTEAVTAAVREVVGRAPEQSTGGGTSDGRFIAPSGAEVVELGPVNASIHKIDECVAVADLAPLTHIYEGILRRLLPLPA